MIEELVSIIIPVYNVEKYLKRCLESVMNQTYKNIEIICINDGSTDRSLKILENYKIQDNRIKVFSQENKGLSETRNRGINLAEGKYIFFIDSDDWIPNSAIENLIKQITNKSIDVVIGGISKIYKKNKEDIVLKKEKIEYTLDEYMAFALKEKKFLAIVCNKMFKKEIISNKNLKFEKGVLYEDFLFTMQYLKECKKIAILDKSIYNYFFIREDSIINKINNKDLDALKSIKKIEKVLEETEIINSKLFKNYIFEWIMSATVSKLFKFGNKQEIVIYRDVLKKDKIFKKYYKYYLKNSNLNYKKLISYVFVNNLTCFLILSYIYKIYKKI